MEGSISAAHTPPTHLRRLTGLRFYAAFTVVVYHISRFFEPMELLSPLVGFGYTGVSFFFVLSGFVLTWSKRPFDTRAGFYLRRFARVWPLHLLTAALAAGIAIATLSATNWAALPFVLTLTQAWVPFGEVRYAFNGPSWSLSCEAFFYLLFPLLIVRIGRTRSLIRVAITTFTAMLTLGSAGVLLLPDKMLGYLFYTMPAFRLGEFIIGITLALMVQRGWRPRFTLRAAVSFTLVTYATLMAVVILCAGHPQSLPEVVADMVILPGFVAIIAAAASSDIAGASGHLDSRLLVRLGQWSFALYLIHQPLIEWVDGFVDGLELVPAAVASLGLVIALVLLSAVLYRFFERPVETWLRERGGVHRGPKGTPGPAPTPSTDDRE